MGRSRILSAAGFLSGAESGGGAAVHNTKNRKDQPSLKFGRE